MVKTVTEFLDRIPPLLCRMVARDPLHPRRRLSLHQLADATGLSYGAVRRLSLKKTWANVPSWKIDKFTAACGVDLLHIKKTVHYLKVTLRSPNGLKYLSATTGKQNTKAIVKMLEQLDL